jgi:hypothetical protein
MQVNDSSMAAIDLLIRLDQEGHPQGLPNTAETLRYFEGRVQFDILADPFEFLAALPDNWTIGVVIETGTMALIMPSNLH